MENIMDRKEKVKKEWNKMLETLFPLLGVDPDSSEIKLPFKYIRKEEISTGFFGLGKKKEVVRKQKYYVWLYKDRPEIDIRDGTGFSMCLSFKEYGPIDYAKRAISKRFIESRKEVSESEQLIKTLQSHVEKISSVASGEECSEIL